MENIQISIHHSVTSLYFLHSTLSIILFLPILSFVSLSPSFLVPLLSLSLCLMDGLHVGSCAASNRETELNHGEVNVKSLVKHLALILPLFPRPLSLSLCHCLLCFHSTYHSPLQNYWNGKVNFCIYILKIWV